MPISHGSNGTSSLISVGGGWGYVFKTHWVYVKLLNKKTKRLMIRISSFQILQIQIFISFLIYAILLVP